MAAMPSGRCLPSAFGMYFRRDGTFANWRRAAAFAALSTAAFAHRSLVHCAVADRTVICALVRHPGAEKAAHEFDPCLFDAREVDLSLGEGVRQGGDLGVRDVADEAAGKRLDLGRERGIPSMGMLKPWRQALRDLAGGRGRCLSADWRG
jgi:hypothetical protein